MPSERRTLLQTKRFSAVEEIITRPDGTVATLQYIEHPGSVAILPLVDKEHVCLIRSRRLSVGETLIEVPAGTREPNEPTLETARRELAEETGYRTGRLEELVSYYPSPGIINERMVVFVARNLTPGEPAREPNEEIENLIVSWNEALAMVDGGQIHDGKTLLAVLTWERRRQTTP
jgi:ADP-ribose pyrophosphatase